VKAHEVTKSRSQCLPECIPVDSIREMLVVQFQGKPPQTIQRFDPCVYSTIGWTCDFCCSLTLYIPLLYIPLLLNSSACLLAALRSVRGTKSRNPPVKISRHFFQREMLGSSVFNVLHKRRFCSARDLHFPARPVFK